MTGHAILTPDDHRELRVRLDYGTEMGDAVMSSIAVPAEFRQLQAEYPILFRRTPERDGFVALALFGFEQGENLFLDGEHWRARYRPLSIDIRPFLVGRTPDGKASQVHVDLGDPRIAGEGTRVFDEEGRPTPYLEGVIDKLGTLDASYRASADFFAALDRHALLEPFTLAVTTADGVEHRLVGYHAIDEARLRGLDGAALAELHAGGHLMPIFMALASLSNLSALLERRTRRDRDG